MLRKLTLLLVLAALFVVTAAPRGGGFGGGRGGFSGGFRSGGSSSRGFGSGGFAGHYGGGSMPYRYGPRIYVGSPWHARTNPAVLWTIVGLIAAIAVVVATSSWYASRFTAVTVGLLLRRGDRCARRLDEIISSSDFREPSGRVRALHRLCKAVDLDDVADGYVLVHARLAERAQAGVAAEGAARNTMQHSGVEARTVNVADLDGNAVQVDAPASAQRNDPDSRCILTIVFTAQTSKLRQITAGGETQAVNALRVASQLTGRELDALYTFYTPDSTETLDAVEAARIFADLRAPASARV